MKKFLLLLFILPTILTAADRLEAQNPFLHINKPWIETVSMYKEYEHKFINPSLDVPQISSHHFNAALQNLILLARSINKRQTDLFLNEYLSNSWIFLLLEQGIDPLSNYQLVSLIEDSVTDLNNVLIPIIDSHNVPPPSMSFENFPVTPEHLIPSHPALQAAQNKLCFLILEHLNFQPSFTLYRSLNNRSVMFGVTSPFSLVQSNIVANQFFLELKNNPTFIKRSKNLLSNIK